MTEELNNSNIEKALRRLGEVFEYHQEVELLLVGGAAGMLTGLLPGSRVTTDCDVMVYIPETAMAAVELAAERVAKELELALTWLNSNVQLRRDALPDGWEKRRIAVLTSGRLSVWAVGRPDLIAMKVLAGRAQDLEDLRMMRVRVDEVAVVRHYLDGLGAKGTSPAEIEDARIVLESLELDET